MKGTHPGFRGQEDGNEAYKRMGNESQFPPWSVSLRSVSSRLFLEWKETDTGPRQVGFVVGMACMDFGHGR